MNIHYFVHAKCGGRRGRFWILLILILYFAFKIQCVDETNNVCHIILDHVMVAL